MGQTKQPNTKKSTLVSPNFRYDELRALSYDEAIQLGPEFFQLYILLVRIDQAWSAECQIGDSDGQVKPKTK